MSASTASRAAPNSAVLSVNWWYSAPRVTPASATIASAGTSAKPCAANSRRAAAISASRVAAERSACVRRARGAAEVWDVIAWLSTSSRARTILVSTNIRTDRMFYSMTTNHVYADLSVADLPQGKLAYRAAGPESSSSPPVVFVHGVLVDGQLWRPVAERLAAEGVRSYAPTLPFGSHQHPMNAGA